MTIDWSKNTTVSPSSGAIYYGAFTPPSGSASIFVDRFDSVFVFTDSFESDIAFNDSFDGSFS